MSLRKYRYLLPLLLGCCLMLLLSACNLQVPSNVTSQSLLTSSGNQSQSKSLALTTSCPAPGTGRAAVLPPLILGKDQNIVYFSDQFNSGTPLSGTLKRYDVATKSKTNILTLTNKNFYSAQVSADGQWVLFVSQKGGQSPLYKLQLVRMDGQDLQTLYCNQSGINEVQWATDQKHIVFVETPSTTELVRLFTTSTGAVQTVLSEPTSSEVIVRTWLDLQSIYLTNTQIDQPPNIIYLLNTSNGSGLMTVFNGSFEDFDSSFDATKLYINTCVCNQGGFSGPSAITVQPATGGQQKTVYSSSEYAITSVRAVLPTTLLFTIWNFTIGDGGDMTHNGLWKIKTDGTGVTRLTTNKAGQGSFFNSYSQFPWSNVSRNGSRYAVATQGIQTQALLIGPLSSGTPTTFASFNGSGTSLSIVGWTTM